MADVSIATGARADTSRGPRAIAFLPDDDQVGYKFYNSAWDIFYVKTTDGGATWGTPVAVTGGFTDLIFDIWPEWWTPGHETSTIIHIWYSSTGTDDVLHKTLDTLDDTLTGNPGNAVYLGTTTLDDATIFVSGTMARNGDLFCAFCINGTTVEKGFYRSQDGGANWSSLDTGFVEAAGDMCHLFPASGTGDDGDCWALYHDADADELSLKLWDASLGSASETAIVALVEDATIYQGPYGFAGALFSDGDLFVSAVTERDTATADHRCFRVGGIGDVVELTAITTNIDDHYYPAPFIDQLTDDIYVAYNGKRDGSQVLGTTSQIFYVKSTDGGTTWSAGDTAYMEGVEDDIARCWAPLMGPRFYVTWRTQPSTSDILGNAVNSLTFAGGEPEPGPTLRTVQSSLRW